jgi:uncharacterized protein YkwD
VRPTGTRLPRLHVLLATILVAGPFAMSGQARPSGSVESDPVLAAALAERIGDLREQRGLGRLERSLGLTRGARDHALSMARHGYFSHSSYDGSSYARRLQHYYAGPVGETIAWTLAPGSARETLTMWLSSTVHRRILLSPVWREVGIGVVQARSARGVFGGDDVTIFVVDVGYRP